MKPVKLPKNESEKDNESKYGHTISEWGKPEDTSQNIIYTYDLKWNTTRNNEKSN